MTDQTKKRLRAVPGPLVAVIPTPELDRRQVLAIDSGKAETLSEFYDWLGQKGYAICTPRPDSNTGAWDPIYIQPEVLFAEFFGLDLNKIEAEKRAILAYMRSRL